MFICVLRFDNRKSNWNYTAKNIKSKNMHHIFVRKSTSMSDGSNGSSRLVDDKCGSVSSLTDRIKPSEVKNYHEKCSLTRSLESLMSNTYCSNHAKSYSFHNHNYEQIKSWSNSLDNLLKDPAGIHNFLIHLKSEHSSENIRFWLACENYKKSSKDKLGEKADIIYKEFLSQHAPYQVNIDSYFLQSVKNTVHRPTYKTFDDVQNEIYLLMKSDSYPRFIKSERYQKLLQDNNPNGKRFEMFLAKQPNDRKSKWYDLKYER